VTTIPRTSPSQQPGQDRVFAVSALARLEGTMPDSLRGGRPDRTAQAVGVCGPQAGVGGSASGGTLHLAEISAAHHRAVEQLGRTG
jgi:hypothetical protein